MLAELEKEMITSKAIGITITATAIRRKILKTTSHLRLMRFKDFSCPCLLAMVSLSFPQNIELSGSIFATSALAARIDTNPTTDW